MQQQLAITASGVVDITDTTDASDATGDTGALRTEGGASIAKKLYVGTDLDVDGTANLDVVDIDGAVDMASTLAVGSDVTIRNSSSTGPSLNIGTTNASVANGGYIGGIMFDHIVQVLALQEYKYYQMGKQIKLQELEQIFLLNVEIMVNHLVKKLGLLVMVK